MKIFRCPHCQSDNTVNTCERCGRHFVITMKRMVGGRREFDDLPVTSIPLNEIQPCDLCISKEGNEKLNKQISIGLSQRTCPNCHTDFLSSYDINK
jgi:hypothetical protein